MVEYQLYAGIFMKKLRKAENAVRLLFLLSVLLAFNSPKEAMMSIFCILLHECAHALGFAGLGGVKSFGSQKGGLLMTGKLTVTPIEVLLVSSLGILANLSLCAVCIPFVLNGSGFFSELSLISFLTAATSALPLPGYDGAEILLSIGCIFGCREKCLSVVKYAGITVGFTLTVLSLYFIEKYALGYWIFGSFFVAFLSSLFSAYNNHDFGEKRRF